MYKKEVIEEHKFKDGSYMRLIKFMKYYTIIDSVKGENTIMVGKALENPIRNFNPPEHIMIYHEFFDFEDMDKALEYYDSIGYTGEIENLVKQRNIMR